MRSFFLDRHVDFPIERQRPVQARVSPGFEAWNALSLCLPPRSITFGQGMVRVYLVGLHMNSQGTSNVWIKTTSCLLFPQRERRLATSSVPVSLSFRMLCNKIVTSVVKIDKASITECLIPVLCCFEQPRLFTNFSC